MNTFENLVILDEIEEEFRKSNRKIQELNNNPSRQDYNERMMEIRKETNRKIVRIFYNYAM